MPCISNYQEPTGHEIENSKVLALLEELKTGKLPKWFGDGSDKRVYNISNQEVLDKNTEKLCSSLKKLPKTKISRSSLEMQIWWRNHQAADKKREAEELKAKKSKALKKRAINKLTLKERKALGI